MAEAVFGDNTSTISASTLLADERRPSVLTRTSLAQTLILS
jgi:hypothetical protein